MIIDSIRIIRVEMPLVYPFRTAFGDIHTIESVLVQLTCDGISGWGESACWGSPAYSSECSSAQFIISKDHIAPVLIGQDVASGNDLQDRLKHIKGNYFAKAAFDLAWWDLHAKIQEKPLWKLLGGVSDSIAVGADFGVMESVGNLLKLINKAMIQGYTRVKLKYRPGWELDMLKQVRNAFPDLPIHIDCNSCYSLADIEMFKELDRYKLVMIEQPLAHDDLIDHATLQKELQTPICLDESIVSAEKVRKAIQIGACKWVNIKLGRVGGITNALEINRICTESNIPCWVGGMLESAIGSSHNLAFATLRNIKYPSDIFPTSRFYDQDLGFPAVEHSAPGRFKASSESGIGIIPNNELLKKITMEQATL
jgi:O-succinylbenzoate synthase